MCKISVQVQVSITKSKYLMLGIKYTCLCVGVAWLLLDLRAETSSQKAFKSDFFSMIDDWIKTYICDI